MAGSIGKGRRAGKLGRVGWHHSGGQRGAALLLPMQMSKDSAKDGHNCGVV